jgi:hypothetical protein
MWGNVTESGEGQYCTVFPRMLQNDGADLVLWKVFEGREKEVG